MQTKQYLRQAYRLNELIEGNKKELAELKAMATSIPSVDYSKDVVQTSKEANASFTKIINKALELERMIHEDTEKMLCLKIEIRRTIDTVEDNEEKLLLRLRYLNFMHWDEVCEAMSISPRTAHRIHGVALKHVKIFNVGTC